MRNYFVQCLALSFIFGCSSYSDNDKKMFDQTISVFIKKTKKTYKVSPSGLHYSIESLGKGRYIQFQDSVCISYTGKLLSGKLVDQQVQPLWFAVRDLIPAWKELLLELKNGGAAYMIIPPHLGYGSNKLEKIPPHSILEFTLRVHDVK